MNKATYERVPMEVFDNLTKRIQEHVDIWNVVTLRYFAFEDVCGTLTIECPYNRLTEYKRTLELFIEERFD